LKLIRAMICLVCLMGMAYGLQVEGEKFTLTPGEAMNYTLNFYNEESDVQNLTVKLTSSNSTYLSCLFDDSSVSKDISIKSKKYHNETVLMKVNGSAPAGNYSCHADFDVPIEAEIQYFSDCPTGTEFCTPEIRETIREVLSNTTTTSVQEPAQTTTITQPGETITKEIEKIPEWMWMLLVGLGLALVIAIALIFKVKTGSLEDDKEIDEMEDDFEPVFDIKKEDISNLKNKAKEWLNKLKWKKKPTQQQPRNFLE